MSDRRRNSLRPAARPRADRRLGRGRRRRRRRSSASTSRAASSSSTRASRPPSSRRSRSESLDRALDIMRQRVDAFGVAEPELARVGYDQIEVNLPGVKNAERAAAAGRHHRPAVLLRLGSERPRRGLQDRPGRSANGGTTPITGLLQRGQAASKCDAAEPTATTTPPTRRASTRSTRSSKQPFNNGQPSRPRGGRCRGPDREEPARTREVVEVPEGILVVRDREGRAPTRPPPDAGGSSQRQPGALGHRHQEPEQNFDQQRRQPADRHVRLHGQGPRRRSSDDHARDRPARRRQRAAGANPQTPPSTSRSCSTTSSSRRRSSTTARTRTASTARTGAQISGGFTIRAPRTWRRSSRSARCRSSSS